MISYLHFIVEFIKFKRRTAKAGKRFEIRWANRYPCFDDRTGSTDFDRHYVYHLSWAAGIVATTRPAAHIDISSSLYFCSIVSSFVPVRFYDFRPVNLQLPGLSCGVADLVKLPFGDGSISSLSCMHVVEHIGLGRYGDPLDPNGDLKAILELRRVLAPGGNLLFVVPIGKPKIMFNAHRIYSHEQVLELFQDLELREFSLIPEDADRGGIITNASKDSADAENYGCGCYWFMRKNV